MPQSLAKFLVLLLPVVLSIAGCGEGLPDADGNLRIAASIFPLGDVARQVGGADVDVLVLLPPGASPHGFQPQPRLAEQLAGRKLLLVVGMGLDLWVERSTPAGAAGPKVLRFADVMTEPPIEAHEHGCAGDEPGHAHVGDPHVWLDPVLMKSFALAAGEAMADADPLRAEAYRKRARDYASELDRLDAEYRETLGKAKRKEFVSFHSAFTYLAARYGLVQAAVFEAHGEGFGPAALERIVSFVKDRSVRVIFAEPQFPDDKLTWLARQTGAAVGRLDPIGNPAVPGYGNYLDLMRSNLKTLSDALSR